MSIEFNNKWIIAILGIVIIGLVAAYPVEYTYEEEVTVEEPYTDVETVGEQQTVTETVEEETRFYFDTGNPDDSRSYHPENHVVFRTQPQYDSDQISSSEKGEIRAEIDTSVNTGGVSPVAELRRAEQAGTVQSCYDLDEYPNDSPEVLDNLASGTGTLSAEADSSTTYCVIVKPSTPAESQPLMETEIEMFWVEEVERETTEIVEKEKKVEKTRETTEIREKSRSEPAILVLYNNLIKQN